MKIWKSEKKNKIKKISWENVHNKKMLWHDFLGRREIEGKKNNVTCWFVKRQT